MPYLNYRINRISHLQNARHILQPRGQLLLGNTARWKHLKAENKKGGPEWKGVVTRMIPIGICLIAVMQWRAYRKGSGERVASEVEISCYRMLPLKSFSRLWGYFADMNIPEFMRPFLYGIYISCFEVNLSEAENENLKSYTSLADFFSRSIKMTTRPINLNSDLVAPCDGTVLHIAEVKSGRVEQVKGITYSIEKFLGANVWNKNNNAGDFQHSLLKHPNKNTKLYQCVIYLAPGDYHRFHSAADWSPSYRRHFPGELLSVNPAIAKWIPELFCLNERAVYIGDWKYGFFSYTAVGATNVGSVRIYFDDKLKMNDRKVNKCNDCCIANNINLQRGELVGEFRMGSTIVLIFEAPSNFQFNVKPGQKVRVGQSIGNITMQTYVDKVEELTEVKVDR